MTGLFRTIQENIALARKILQMFGSDLSNIFLAHAIFSYIILNASQYYINIFKTNLWYDDMKVTGLGDY